MTARTSIWPVSQRSVRAQRRGRYLPESTPHPGKMLPDLARRAIETFSGPGDLVVDPMCGIGTTLVEAAHLGRDGFGIEYEPQWASVVAANLALARAAGASGRGGVVVGDCRDLLALVPPDAIGQVALLLTSPPYGSVTHGQLDKTPDGVKKSHFRYSADRSNLAYARQHVLLDAVVTMLQGARRLLARDGVVVLTARPWRRNGALVDFPGALVRCASEAGLRLVERDVALLAAVSGGELVPRASFFHLKQVRLARERGHPQLVVAHEDVLVFGRRP